MLDNFKSILIIQNFDTLETSKLIKQIIHLVLLEEEKKTPTLFI